MMGMGKGKNASILASFSHFHHFSSTNLVTSLKIFTPPFPMPNPLNVQEALAAIEHHIPGNVLNDLRRELEDKVRVEAGTGEIAASIHRVRLRALEQLHGGGNDQQREEVVGAFDFLLEQADAWGEGRGERCSHSGDDCDDIMNQPEAFLSN